MSTIKPYLTEEILIADDEPIYLGFLIDHLVNKKYKVKLAETADDAIAAATEKNYRAYVVDLNIPASSTLKAAARKRDLEESFPGISIARAILTSGVSPGKVLIYSVHLTDALNAEIERLGVEYVQKGRPRNIKEALDRVLSYDPRTATATKSKL
jgi:CheY-like chemotaxis protein